jgi:hypothetical protein
MKKQMQILGVGFILLALSISAFGRKPTRIKFKKGATAATLTGKLSGYKGEVDYVIRLRQGQRLQVSSDRSVTLSVLNPVGEDVMDRAANCNGTADISTTVEGDYRIQVVECTKADSWHGTFKLRIKVK